MASRSLFRAGDPTEDDSGPAPTQEMPVARPPVAAPDRGPTGQGEGTRRRTMLWIGASLLAVVSLGLAGALTWSLIDSAQTRDEHRKEVRALRVDHARAIADLRAEAAEHERDAVAAAVADQKREDARRLRRAIAAERRKAKRRIEEARAAGYSAGNVEGYSEGTIDGYDQGLLEGSDELDCSDDPDVYWLPLCW